MTNDHRVIIIGSGPAGYTAALYAARADLKPLVIEGSITAGGALMNTTDVENFPGFPEGIMGPELMDRFREQAEKFGAELIPEDVISVKLTDSVKTVKLDNGNTLTADSLIIATGSAHKKLGLFNEDALSGHGVSYCATCDAPFFRDKPIVVVGGGDTALEEALFLAKFGESVTVVVRGGSLRASKIMQDRAFADPKLSFLYHTQVDALGEDDGSLDSVRLYERLPDNEGLQYKIAAKGLFVAIGHEPRSQLFGDYLSIDDLGYLVQDGSHGNTSTSIPGVFVAGDVADHRYRQAITAAGSGAQAALDVEKWLTENN